MGEDAFRFRYRAGLFVFGHEKGHLVGHTPDIRPSNCLTGHSAPEHGVDGVEEAGFAGSNGAHQQDPGLGDGPDAGLVIENVLHQLLPPPTGDINRSEGDFRA